MILGMICAIILDYQIKGISIEGISIFPLLWSCTLNRAFFPAQSAFGCIRITKTGHELFDLHVFLPLIGNRAQPIFSNSHTSECELRRKGYPINSIGRSFLRSLHSDV